MKKKAHKKKTKHVVHHKKQQPMYWYLVPFIAILIGGVTLFTVLTTVFASVGGR